MPIDYQIYEDGLYVYARATGILTPQEIKDHAMKLKLNPKIKRGYRELFDGRHIEKSEVTKNSLQEIIKEIMSDEKIIYRNKLAIVTGSADSFDRAKYYEKTIPSAKQNVIVFTTLETAKVWLNVDKPQT
jgi:hypothetical protein